jgi:hypothetical protein
MKFQKLLVIVVSVCLIAFFNVSSFAKTDKKTQNVDIYALASALEDAGLEVVKTKWNSLGFIAPNGEVVNFKFNHKRKEVTVTVDGDKVIKLDANNLAAIEQQGNGINLFECIIVALNIYSLNLDLCEFDSAGLDLLCVPEATFEFALNILRCVQFIGEDPI